MKKISTLTGILFILWFLVSPIVGIILYFQFGAVNSHFLSPIICILISYLFLGILGYLITKKFTKKDRGSNDDSDKINIGAIGKENKVVKATMNQAGSYHSLLWWKIDPPELQAQVDGYDTLSIFKSARGQSAIFLIFSALVTFILIKSDPQIFDNSDYIDIAILLIFSFFVYRGHRWALIGVMIYWTAGKIFSLSTHIGSPIVQIIWWAIFMSYLWLAYKVELERRKQKEILLNHSL